MKNIGIMIGTLCSGGAERVVAHLSHILSQEYNVHVILFEDTFMEYSCSGTVCNLNVPAQEGNVFVKLKLLRCRITELKKLIKKEKLECVISFLDSPNFVNLLANASGCQKIISIRNYSGLENRQSALGKLTDAAMKLLYRRADAVITVSKLIEQDFRNHYGIPAHKLHTIYNPYNFEEIHSKGDIPLTQNEQSFYDSGFVFVNVGRVMYQKGHWHLVKAFAQVHKEHPQAKLVVVGEDLSQGKLTDLIEALDLRDSVLLTGRTRNPYQYMKNADCYVLTSLFEGFPNAMVEAMACGCSIIAADCKSGPREILYKHPTLEDSVNDITEADYGLLVPPLEAKEDWEMSELTPGERKLMKAMEAIMMKPERCGEYAQKAQKRSCDFGYDAARRAFSKII